MEQAARVCYPSPKRDGIDKKYPLLLFAHGDAIGGLLFNPLYGDLQQRLAGHGFVVPAYLSCWLDTVCKNGQKSFLEALKTFQFFEHHPNKTIPIDFSLPYTVIGHSTGARVALMLAALKDTMTANGTSAYLHNVSAVGDVSTFSQTLRKIKAVIAYHPDAMYKESLNPDIGNFNVTQTPVMIMTGSEDTFWEPKGSAWKDFQMLQVSNKVFVNLFGAPHYDLDLVKRDAPFMAYFAQKWSLGNTTAGRIVCGHTSDSLQNMVRAKNGGTDIGDPNNGGAGENFQKVAFLCCTGHGTAVPEQHSKYCSTAPFFSAPLKAI
jgi:hypothetical protein